MKRQYVRLESNVTYLVNYPARLSVEKFRYWDMELWGRCIAEDSKYFLVKYTNRENEQVKRWVSKKNVRLM